MALINAVCGIESLGEEKKNMLERVLQSTYVKLETPRTLFSGRGASFEMVDAVKYRIVGKCLEGISGGDGVCHT